MNHDAGDAARREVDREALHRRVNRRFELRYAYEPPEELSAIEPMRLVTVTIACRGPSRRSRRRPRSSARDRARWRRGLGPGRVVEGADLLGRRTADARVIQQKVEWFAAKRRRQPPHARRIIHVHRKDRMRSVLSRSSCSSFADPGERQAARLSSRTPHTGARTRGRGHDSRRLGGQCGIPCADPNIGALLHADGRATNLPASMTKLD